MDVPDLVTDALNGESVLASVNTGGEDGVFVTPERTLVYKGDGLLSDESVAAHAHGFDRLELSSGRRRTAFELHYYDHEESFAVGSNYAQEVVETVLAAHLRATGALSDDEQVRGVFRFNELTVVVGTQRLLKHVGGAVWSEDYEAHPYADLTRLDFEEGSHAMQVVVAVEGRPERIKVPNDRAPTVRRTIEEAVLAFHDVDSLEALNEAIAPEEVEERSGPDYADSGIDSLIGEDRETTDEPPTDDGPLPSTDEPPTDTGAEGDAGADVDDESTPEGFVSASDKEVLERLETLERKVDEQTDLIERQQETIEQLVDELRRGR
ncbi:DUF7115 domain-containing protein [Haloglomus litoreum]|uniref:DUF7115 domain-containing protein n=1 Tax=Haloglomus litoreum TaxID=3034026 RepID=UPI0023E823AD|nr:hypothetical protein [Haloglomus sp. DT116]